MQWCLKPRKEARSPGNKIPLQMRKLMDRRRRLGIKILHMTMEPWLRSSAPSSVFSTAREEVTQEFSEEAQADGPSLETVTFSQERIEATIKSLSNSAAPGPGEGPRSSRL